MRKIKHYFGPYSENALFKTIENLSQKVLLMYQVTWTI